MLVEFGKELDSRSFILTGTVNLRATVGSEPQRGCSCQSRGVQTAADWSSPELDSFAITSTDGAL
jgi:hypothetical protein